MNNILPSDVEIHERYDLKGSFINRQANEKERMKSRPTFKDLDFLETHPNGIIVIDEKIYDSIIDNLKQDSLVSLISYNKKRGFKALLL